MNHFLTELISYRLWERSVKKERKIKNNYEQEIKKLREEIEIKEKKNKIKENNRWIKYCYIN